MLVVEQPDSLLIECENRTSCNATDAQSEQATIFRLFCSFFGANSGSAFVTSPDSIVSHLSLAVKTIYDMLRGQYLAGDIGRRSSLKLLFHNHVGFAAQDQS